MVIELYERNKNVQFMYVNLGYRTVDLKDKIVFLTKEPENKEERYEFAEELSKKREFRTD